MVGVERFVLADRDRLSSADGLYGSELRRMSPSQYVSVRHSYLIDSPA